MSSFFAARHRIAATVARRLYCAWILGAAIACHSSASGPAVEDTLTPEGFGAVTSRYTSEVTVHGNFAYTSTWGTRNGVVGNAVYVWNVAGAVVPTDSLVIDGATTTGDVQVTDDGRLLVVATEPGSLVIYSLSDPAHPSLLKRYTSPHIANGVHTAEVQRVDGTLYAFLSIDPGNGVKARLVILDLSDPTNPGEVFLREMGNPYQHDVFVADGVLFTAEWNDGIRIWDIGRGAGQPGAPLQLGAMKTAGGSAHNIWWMRDRATSVRRFAFVGEEQGGSLGVSAGDIHVVDVSDLANPREVAFFHLRGAGTHNFSLDESRGILYAAYYNAGVIALDVTGDLSKCDAARRAADGRCDIGDRRIASGLGNGHYVWGVQQVGAYVYASDMLTGLWKLDALRIP